MMTTTAAIPPIMAPIEETDDDDEPDPGPPLSPLLLGLFGTDPGPEVGTDSPPVPLPPPDPIPVPPTVAPFEVVLPPTPLLPVDGDGRMIEAVATGTPPPPSVVVLGSVVGLGDRDVGGSVGGTVVIGTSVGNSEPVVTGSVVGAQVSGVPVSVVHVAVFCRL